jgi:predicted nucleotidyltransferase
MKITQQNIENVIQTIVNADMPEKVMIFGSLASATDTQHSDLDLIVIKNTNKPKHQRTAHIWQALSQQRFMFPIDILVYTPQEYETEYHTPHTFIYNIKTTLINIYTQNAQ